MQTTLRLDDDLYRRAEAEAARQKITVAQLIEQSLRLRLTRPAVSPESVRLHRAGTGVPFDVTPEELKRLIQETDIQALPSRQP